MPEPGPDVVPCSWDMGDARSAYFSRSKEQPVHLEDFDSDFGVFETPSNQSGPPSPTKPPPWPSFPSSRLNFPPAQLSARIPQPSTWPQATAPPPQPNPPPSPPCATSPPQLCAFYSNPRPSAPGASESSAAELAPRRNRWLDEDGALVLPQRHCSAVLLVSPVPGRKRKGGASSADSPADSPSSANPDSNPEGKQRKRMRGSGSKGGTHGNRARAGKALSESGGAAEPARLARLQERSHVKGQVVQATYSIEKEGSVTTTGWLGVCPPNLAQNQILELYESGEIKSLLASFYPVAYSP